MHNNAFKRNTGLDIAKYICSFMVICIHMQYPGKIYLEPLTRFAVPFFFMITGYFYSSVQKMGKAPAQIRKLCKLFAGGGLLYLLWGVLRQWLKGRPVFDYLASFLQLSLWKQFIYYNSFFLAEHLWYINALLYVLVIVFIFDKICGRGILYGAIPLLLLMNVVLGNYSCVLFGTIMPLSYSRNFLFVGLPFFLLGDFLHKKKPEMKNGHLLVILVVSIFITELENLFLLNTGLMFNADFFIGTTFLACSLFLLVIQNEGIMKAGWLSAAAALGKQTSTTIYIIHPIVKSVIGNAVRAMGRYIAIVPRIYEYCGPFVVLLASTVFGLLLNVGKKKISLVLRKG